MMFLLGRGKKNNANVAHARLQVILMHERSGPNSTPHHTQALQAAVLAVISRYFKIAREDLKVDFDRQDGLDVFEVKIEIPPRPDDFLSQMQRELVTVTSKYVTLPIDVVVNLERQGGLEVLQVKITVPQRRD